jgi:cytochrome b561
MSEHRTSSYKSGAKALHWLLALMVFGLLGLGLYMTGLKTTPQKIQLYMTHKSVGLTVLLLMLIRLLYRWRNPAPALPAAMAAWQKRLASLTHIALYLLLFAMPISGWLMNSASGFPMKYFGWFRVPDLIARDAERLAFFKTAHEYIAWTLIALLALHVLAALKHHFLNRDDVLRRMLPGISASSPGVKI